ncbi:MAG: hypothetical protein Q8R00_00925 [Candidatus Nanoarchaeia archaeon]|nr:hypothetical protein [Candidatus Nanoarchaeia archaeon]
METSVKKDILGILNEAISAIDQNNLSKLKEVSDHTIHDASIFQDNNSVNIAVLMYSLGKIYERTRYKEFKDWEKFNSCVKSKLRLAKDYLMKDDIKGYEINIKSIFVCIEGLDHKLKDYTKEVFETSKVSKGSRLHEHGLSLGRASEILGINSWELKKYVGGTGIYDVGESVTKDIRKRLKYGRSLFA